MSANPLLVRSYTIDSPYRGCYCCIGRSYFVPLVERWHREYSRLTRRTFGVISMYAANGTTHGCIDVRLTLRSLACAENKRFINDSLIQGGEMRYHSFRGSYALAKHPLIWQPKLLTDLRSPAEQYCPFPTGIVSLQDISRCD
ncbi:hypothetical protein Hypma_008638 [Hypsizygus marmoreus]|uniref:Uncharacterized protein n=1 Tax=Hypsizygus marmoreus TaxID=39966 RepID=A0A369JZ80_HYPMA|nr:hypothetical protein Hypma_008638 [Hypsizygus marmoreus]